MIVNDYKEVLLSSFYLDDDDITVRRKIDGKNRRYKKHDIVTGMPYKSGYNCVHVPTSKKKVVPIHQLITLLRGIDIPDGYVIDHINGNKQDHRRVNIRVVTQGENNRNSRMRKDNTTGYTGITISKTGKYVVRKWIDGKRLFRYGNTLEEAIEHKRELDELGKNYGYTNRHGK